MYLLTCSCCLSIDPSDVFVWIERVACVSIRHHEIPSRSFRSNASNLRFHHVSGTINTIATEPSSCISILHRQTMLSAVLVIISPFCDSRYSFEAVAQLLAVVFANPLLGMLQYVNLWFCSFLFCGLFLPIQNIVWPLRVFSYIMPFR